MSDILIKRKICHQRQGAINNDTTAGDLLQDDKARLAARDLQPSFPVHCTGLVHPFARLDRDRRSFAPLQGLVLLHQGAHQRCRLEQDAFAEFIVRQVG